MRIANPVQVLGLGVILKILCGSLVAHGFTPPPKYPSHFHVEINDAVYKVTDKNNERFHAHGWLDIDKDVTRLRLDFSTKQIVTEPGSQREVRWSDFLRGKTELENILRHFEGRFAGIKAYWEDGDNFSQFYRLYHYGVPAELAAAQTWTGKMAAHHGYTKISVATIDFSYGPYVDPKVIIYFDRPPPTSLKEGCEEALEGHDLSASLILATALGDENAVAGLLAAGANPNPQMTEENLVEAPLIIAAREGYLGIAKQLVAAGASLKAHSRAFSSFRAVDCARNGGHQDVYAYLKGLD